MQGKKFIGACRQGLRERFLGGSRKGVGIGTGQAGNPRDFTASFSGWERRGVFVDGGDDGIHAFLDFADLRMDFLNEVMFQLREFFDAFALFLEPGQKLVLIDGNPAHPPKAEAPTNHARQGHPEVELVEIHGGAVA